MNGPKKRREPSDYMKMPMFFIKNDGQMDEVAKIESGANLYKGWVEQFLRFF